MKQITVVGYLGNDARLQESNGKKVINFSVATTEKYKDSNGTAVEKTTWVDCSLWDKENLAEWLKKGTQVLVQGNPEAYAYIAKDSGDLKATLRCKVQTLQLLGSKKEATQTATSTTTKTVAPAEPLMPENLDKEPAGVVDDLPF